jgi:D-alanyl-D-alanine carboxypeptidase
MTVGIRGVVSFAAALALVFGASTPAAAAKGNPKYAAIVMHADSGDVLFARAPDEKRYPASLTKMMTLYLLFEELEAGRMTLDQSLAVSAQAAGQPPSKLGLSSGSTIDVETAIEALVVKSANDVAVTVAESISGSEWKFAQAMTRKAAALGMRSTTFKNASGLPNSKQTTTARDLVTLSRRLVQDFPQYFDYFDIESFTWNGRTYRTHNALVKTFDGADGLKTGYTQRSGFNLATTASRDGSRLIGVVLGGRSVRTRDAHMREILTASFESIRSNPTLIAALHRATPSPRLKPTLVAMLAANNTPALTADAGVRQEMTLAAASFAPVGPAPRSDAISALISAAGSVGFGDYEGQPMTDADLDASLDSVGEGDIEDERAWSVQIGAFRSKTLAQQELEAAALASRAVDVARAVSPIVEKSGATIYRARFTSLSEFDAVAVCARIKAAQLSCFAVEDVAQ